MPYKHNEPRRHKIPKAKYKVSNWQEYDQALQQRGSLTVWVTPEALEAWAPEKSGRRGRPTSYSDIVIETAVMLRLAMGKPWRQTEGMLRSIIRMLGLDLSVPDHTTLSRRSARLSLTTTLKKPKGPVNVVIDSSGLKIFGAGEWLHEKHGGKPRRSWRRLHLAVDPDSSEILAAELTTTDEGDNYDSGYRHGSGYSHGHARTVCYFNSSVNHYWYDYRPVGEVYATQVKRVPSGGVDTGN